MRKETYERLTLESQTSNVSRSEYVERALDMAFNSITLVPSSETTSTNQAMLWEIERLKQSWGLD